MNNDPKIKLLSPGVVEKIAAGEVVERPASVLKELIENAIDAGATRIDVSCEEAGFALIKVTDNGCGIAQHDLHSALVRHATSKISTADDLYALSTMGFRGEALASIAAVSRLALISSPTQDGLGFSIRGEAGSISIPEPAAHLRGTTVEIRDLFFNVPARKKFMKTQRAESMALIRSIEQVCIAFPGIHFTAFSDGRKLLDTPVVDTVAHRIGQIAGNDFARTLIVCTGEGPGIDMVLHISPPESSQSRPRFQNLYVNLRRVDNESVTAAVREGYARFIGFDRRASFFCFLDIDPGRVDVNVHPTKRVVKFDDEKGIFRFIYGSIQRTLGARTGIEPVHHPHDSAGDRISAISRPDAVPLLLMEIDPPPRQSPNPVAPVTADPAIVPFPATGVSASGSFRVDKPAPTSVQLGDGIHGEFWGLISCYQIHAMYILAPIKNGILLIDQHAAHERILYEQALADLKRGRSESQQLLFPVTIELTPGEKAVIDSTGDFFRGFGFEISAFSGTTVCVSAIPASMRESGVEPAIRTMLQSLMDGEDARTFTEPEKRFAAAFACGAAIKTGKRMDQEEMNALLNGLFATENPYVCPHGRPVVVRISLDELSRRFLR